MAEYKKRKNSIAYWIGKAAAAITVLAFWALAFSMVWMAAIAWVYVRADTVETQVVEVGDAVYRQEETADVTYDVPLDGDLIDYTISTCEIYGIDPALVFAMMEVESGFTANITGDNGESLGLLQIQPKWHADRMAFLGVNDLLDPYQNITVGANIISEKISAGKGLEWALAAYNGGDAYADKLVAAGEISEYAVKVLKAMEGIS